MKSAASDPPEGSRASLRKSLLTKRELFVSGPAHQAAAAALSRHVVDVLSELEPELLGLYWPQAGEFNAVLALGGHSWFTRGAIALPYARRQPPRMHYRAWDGRSPEATDECGIPSSTGREVLPDVVLVPCVGYAAPGWRLGYGGGYFDRWMAKNPDVTTIGLAWRVGEMAEGAFAPEAHDRPLTLVITEDGVV